MSDHGVYSSGWSLASVLSFPFRTFGPSISLRVFALSQVTLHSVLSICDVCWGGGALILTVRRADRTDLRCHWSHRSPMGSNSFSSCPSHCSAWQRAACCGLAQSQLVVVLPCRFRHDFRLTSASKEDILSGHMSILLQVCLSLRVSACYGASLWVFDFSSSLVSKKTCAATCLFFFRFSRLVSQLVALFKVGYRSVRSLCC